MAEQSQGGGNGPPGRGLVDSVKQLAGTEARLLQRYAQAAARSTAHGAALGGAGMALAMCALGALGVALGLALVGRPARRAGLASLGLIAASGALIFRGWRELPWDTFAAARDSLRQQARVLHAVH
jgi:Putative Actinobacterial Holin-X, holin superfamily III